MAKLTKNKEYIVEQYVRYFGKTPTKAQIDEYAEVGKPKEILKQITGDANDAKPSNITYDDYIDSIFQNLFGRPASGPEKTKYAKTYDKKGVLPINSIVKSAKKSDKDVYQTKKLVALLIAEKGSATNIDLDKITKDTYKLIYNPQTKKLSVDTVAQLETKIDAMPDNVSGTTFNLTTGIDPLVGTEKGDVFNAVQTGTAFVLGALDTIDGGAGVDTLNVQDTTTAAGSFSFGGATIKNVENINVTTNGDFTSLDTTAITGLTSFTGKAAGTVATTLTVADTTDVTLTLGTTNNSTVNGGKAVSVTKGATAAGNLGITGKALTDVTVKGGIGVLTIDNTGGAAGTTTAIGTTLKTVTLDGVTGVLTAIKGAAIDTLVLKNQIAVQTTTITNDTSTSLTIKADGVGYTAAGAAATNTVNAGSKAATLNVEATGAKSALTLTGTAAKTVNITGTAALDLAQIATATKIDGSAATGNLTLNTLAAITVDVKTGSGKDSLTLSATTKATVDTGAGNDTVTLGSAVAAGSTINLGAGNDTLLVSAGSVAASTVTAVTTIDAGEGIDTLAAALVNAANAAQFKNFESLDLTNATGTALDVELMTASTITGLTLSNTKGATTVNNVAAGVGLTVNANADTLAVANGTGAVTSTIGVKNAATGTADSFAITFAGTAGTAATATAKDQINAGIIKVDGVETLSISSTGTGFVSNSAVITDSALQTLTVAGAQDMTLTFAGVNGTAVTGVTDTVNGIKMIDASALTGVFKIDTTTTGTINIANVGLTIKSGSANDSITLGQKATVDAGAGDDIIITSAAGGTLTGGAGKDKFDVSLAVATGTTEATSVLTTITDLSAGDSIAFGATATGAFNTTKVALGAGVTNLDLALAAQAGAANTTSWFQYAGNTYVVSNDADVAFDAGDTVVKISGLVDLSTATLSSTVLTIA